MSVADSTMTATAALPAQGASVELDSVDLGADRVGAIGSRMALHIKSDALPALVEGETITPIVQDSADGENFEDLVTLHPAVVTGEVGDGAAAKESRLYLPPDARRHVRLKATASAGAGDNTAANISLEWHLQ